MSAFAEWEDLARGGKCPFDVPRAENNEHWDRVATLAVSTLYLHKIQTYRGYCLLVFDPRHVTELTQLNDDERTALVSDLCRAQDVLRKVVRPDHFNLESLGKGKSFVAPPAQGCPCRLVDFQHAAEN